MITSVFGKQEQLQKLTQDIQNVCKRGNDAALASYPLSIFSIPEDFEKSSVKSVAANQGYDLLKGSFDSWSVTFPLENETEVSSNFVVRGDPMENEFVCVKCKVCGKSVLAQNLEEHSNSCTVAIVKVEQPKIVVIPPEVIVQPPAPVDPLPSDSSKESKPKSRKKVSKKVSLDLGRHCGVLIMPSATPCTRSLTCKSHSLASKRAVSGRPREFDFLYQEHMERIHNTKNVPTKAATRADSISDSKVPDIEVEPEIDLIAAVRDYPFRPVCSKRYCVPVQRMNSYYLRNIFTNIFPQLHKDKMESSTTDITSVPTPSAVSSQVLMSSRTHPSLHIPSQNFVPKPVSKKVKKPKDPKKKPPKKNVTSVL